GFGRLPPGDDSSAAGRGRDGGRAVAKWGGGHLPQGLPGGRSGRDRGSTAPGRRQPGRGQRTAGDLADDPPQQAPRPRPGGREAAVPASGAGRVTAALLRQVVLADRFSPSMTYLFDNTHPSSPARAKPTALMTACVRIMVGTSSQYVCQYMPAA